MYFLSSQKFYNDAPILLLLLFSFYHRHCFQNPNQLRIISKNPPNTGRGSSTLVILLPTLSLLWSIIWGFFVYFIFFANRLDDFLGIFFEGRFEVDFWWFLAPFWAGFLHRFCNFWQDFCKQILHVILEGQKLQKIRNVGGAGGRGGGLWEPESGS